MAKGFVGLGLVQTKRIQFFRKAANKSGISAGDLIYIGLVFLPRKRIQFFRKAANKSRISAGAVMYRIILSPIARRTRAL
jgi:hypothetical protein